MFKKINPLILRLFKSDIFKVLIIIFLAIFLRTFRLSFSPPRLTHDEMSIGYNAFSILKTGKDEWGRSFPLDFEAFGDHKLPGYIYSLVPLLNFLPLNSITLKIPSILAGIFTVFGISLLVKEVTKNKNIAFLSAFILAVSPWAIHISRMALESNMALTMFIWGLYFLVKTFDKKLDKKYWSFLAGMFFALSTYFYIAYRMISALVLISFLVLGIIYKLNKKKIFFVFISFLIFTLPLASEMVGKSGSARFDQVSIFSNDGIEATILEQQNFCFLSQPRFLPKICRVIYNKPFLYIEKLSKNYLTFIFPTFLFIEGDQLEYLNDPAFAEFYLFLAPFYLLGLYSWYKKSGFKENLIKLSFLIAPIPSALVGDPQIVRGSVLLIFVSLFTAVGIYDVFENIKKKAFKNIYLILMFVIFAISISRFFISYSYIYPGKYENSFYQLSEEMANFLSEKESEYDLIYINKSIYPDAHILIAFYKNLDPSWYQENIIRSEPDDFGFSHPIGLDKYEFGDNLIDQYICEKSDQKILFVSNNIDIQSQFVFKDFSGVHKQAQMFDIDKTRDYLVNKKLIKNICN